MTRKRGRPATGRIREEHKITVTPEEWAYLTNHGMPASEFISQLIADHQAVQSGELELRIRPSTNKEEHTDD